MKKLLAFALVLGAGTSHAGGLGTIEGSVVASSGSIAGARVEIVCGGIRRSVTVDGAGSFTVSGLPEGACMVTIRRSGFADSARMVTVTGGSIASVLISMYPPVEHESVPNVVSPAAAEAPDPPRAAHRQPARQKPEAKLAEAKPLPTPVIVRLDGKRRPHHRRIGVKSPPPELVNAHGEFAPVRVFPVPQYTKGGGGPRTDFRETIYWNPNVQTDATGQAEVTFFVSDAVTAFRATAEGFSSTGLPGSGQVAIQSKLPFTLDAKLPVEVTAGDTIQLPVTLANETGEPIDATLDATFGTAFKLVSSPISGAIRLAPGEKKAIIFPLDVIATSGTADVSLAARADGLSDELRKTIRVVPRGFPFELSAAGTAKRGQVARHELDLSSALQGTIEATVTMYASPVASMTQGMEGMIREPYGCFEQTSATNYPNIMILSYLQAHDVAEPALVDKTHGMLDRGYKLLTGFETKQRGYEWFGHAPGHEALTAYGLMEFADMAKVYDVDATMVQRTADWLTSRRDGKGGFQRAKGALDTFGRASDATTNAYIMWALAEAKRTGGLDIELAAQRRLAESTRDPYQLALATRTLWLAKRDNTGAHRLAAMQSTDGSFPGAKESITKSGGASLVIETTALAIIALLESPDHATQVRAAVDWLNQQRRGTGAWSNTQATVLGLKALTAYSESQRKTQTGGTATLIVNGKRMQSIEFEAGRKEPLVWNDLARHLGSAKNVVEIELASDSTLPYSIAIGYRSARPQSSPSAKVAVTSTLVKTQAKMGEGVALRVRVENTTAEGLPMTLARVGIPGGMVFQSWQLKELRDKGLVDFYETRPREVILYWRQLAPSAKHELDIALLATVPGTYEAPASSTYLYYTAEDKAWSPPVKVAIDR